MTRCDAQRSSRVPPEKFQTMLSAVGSPELARDAHVGAIAPPIGRDDARRRAFGIGAVSLACVGSPGWVLTSTIASDIAE